jgi:hypothetical protein
MVAEGTFEANVEDSVVGDVGVLGSSEGQRGFFERAVKGWEKVGRFA